MLADGIITSSGNEIGTSDKISGRTDIENFRAHEIGIWKRLRKREPKSRTRDGANKAYSVLFLFDMESTCHSHPK